jgi:hypothetical protein
MSLRDLLWACPECRGVGAVSVTGTCQCGVTYERARGARIRANRPDGTVVDRSAAEWVDLLPPVEGLLPAEESGPVIVRTATVVAREVTGSAPVREGGRFLNRIERYDQQRDGALELLRDRIVYRPAGGRDRVWPLDTVTAIQASSRTLQIKVRDQPLVSFGFEDDSVLLWELLLQAALRDFYRRSGRGEIVEFQPRITTRA